MAFGFKPINLGNLNNPHDIAKLSHHLKDLYSKVNPVITGKTAPTAPPPQIGAEYIDTVGHKVYKAKGTASVSDWLVLN